MGSFDEIKVSCPLPMKHFQGRTFQTKSLECFQESYWIDEEGQLWRYIHDNTDNGARGWIKVRHTGEIRFYGRVDESKDWGEESGWIDFSVYLEKGTVKLANVISYRAPAAVIATAEVK